MSYIPLSELKGSIEEVLKAVRHLRRGGDRHFQDAGDWGLWAVDEGSGDWENTGIR